MRFAELNPPIIELAAGQVFHRVQLIRPRSNSVLLNGLSLPPVGLRHGRFCLADDPVAYLADSAETALYESLLRRETVSLHPSVPRGVLFAGNTAAGRPARTGRTLSGVAVDACSAHADLRG